MLSSQVGRDLQAMVIAVRAPVASGLFMGRDGNSFTAVRTGASWVVAQRPLHHASTMAIVPAAMRIAVSQPSRRSQCGSTRLPMTLGSEPSTTIAAISGAAITPLITADQNSALIGSSGEKAIAVPTSVDPAMVA